jgi:hypothetical protein
LKSDPRVPSSLSDATNVMTLRIGWPSGTWASLGVVTNQTGRFIYPDTEGDPQTAACF